MVMVENRVVSWTTNDHSNGLYQAVRKLFIYPRVPSQAGQI
jgi:hypothetical protein